MSLEYVIVDGIKWWVSNTAGIRTPVPICMKHNLRMHTVRDYYSGTTIDLTKTLNCEDCDQDFKLGRSFREQKVYVLDKIDSKIFNNTKFINLDDEAIPIAKVKVPSNSDFFATGILTQSKTGLRLVIYAGIKGKGGEKTQLFVEPEIRRLAFDQNNIHPSKIFVKVEAEFEDSSKAIISQK